MADYTYGGCPYQWRKAILKMVDILFGKNYNVVCSRASAKFKSKRLIDYISSLKFS
jgi:hypothetical protein